MKFIGYICHRKSILMRTQKEYIDALKAFAPVMRERFGVTSMRLFGSVARNEQTDQSDLDLFVEMPAKMFLVISLKQTLEEKFSSKVDIIRKHIGLNPYLKTQIDQDGITIF